jgi:hypothetical protein
MTTLYKVDISGSMSGIIDKIPLNVKNSSALTTAAGHAITKTVRFCICTFYLKKPVDPVNPV